MQISFYLLQVHHDRLTLACRLCLKALQTIEHSIVLLTPASKQHALDELLWSFSATSFVPHGIDDQSPVVISDNVQAGFDGIVINLTAQALTIDSPARLIELVAADDDSKALGRKKYKQYAQQFGKPEFFNL